MAVADWTVLGFKQGFRLRSQFSLIPLAAFCETEFFPTQVSEFAHTNDILRPSSEAKSRSSGQEIPRSLQNSHIIIVIAKFRRLYLYLARLIQLTLFHAIPVKLILLFSSNLKIGFHS